MMIIRRIAFLAALASLWHTPATAEPGLLDRLTSQVAFFCEEEGGQSGIIQFVRDADGKIEMPNWPSAIVTADGEEYSIYEDGNLLRVGPNKLVSVMGGKLRTGKCTDISLDMVDGIKTALGVEDETDLEAIRQDVQSEIGTSVPPACIRAVAQVARLSTGLTPDRLASKSQNYLETVLTPFTSSVDRMQSACPPELTTRP